jgi:hypothetical protein
MVSKPNQETCVVLAKELLGELKRIRSPLPDLKCLRFTFRKSDICKHCLALCVEVNIFLDNCALKSPLLQLRCSSAKKGQKVTCTESQERLREEEGR